jgi:hypothetical protein
MWEHNRKEAKKVLSRLDVAIQMFESFLDKVVLFVCLFVCVISFLFFCFVVFFFC